MNDHRACATAHSSPLRAAHLGRGLPPGATIRARSSCALRCNQGRVDLWQSHTRTSDGTGVTGGMRARASLPVYGETRETDEQERLRSGLAPPFMNRLCPPNQAERGARARDSDQTGGSVPCRGRRPVSALPAVSRMVAMSNASMSNASSAVGIGARTAPTASTEPTSFRPSWR